MTYKRQTFISFKKSFFLIIHIPNHFENIPATVHRFEAALYQYCQAQPQLQLQIWLRLVLVSIPPKPPTHPPARAAIIPH